MRLLHFSITHYLGKFMHTNDRATLKTMYWTAKKPIMREILVAIL